MKQMSSALRTTLLAGVILFGLIIIILTVFYFINLSGTKLQRMQDNFSRALKEYDLYSSYVPGFERDFNKLQDDLDRLEKMTISVESWLSVLKRRRSLYLIYPESKEKYRKSVEKALSIYPASQPIIALTAELLVRDIAITNEAEEKIRNWIPLLTDADYNSIRLSLHVLLGDFRNIERAKSIPDSLVSDGTESVTINLILLRILRDDIIGAAAAVQSMFYNLAPSIDGLRFIAEFFYDFGDLERSAEIFSMINDDKAISRASDALYLAGYEGSARNMWRLLTQRHNGTAEDVKILEKSLYNLGITSENNEEGITYFERLLEIDTDDVSDFKQYGLIRYSRLLDLPEALEALHETRGLNPKGYPYIDLEICKRQLIQWELKRQMAESWLLIDRHPEDEDLYRWVSWLFLYQRDYSETQILLNRIDKLNIKGQWVLENKAIYNMFDGNIVEAETILTNITKSDAGWVSYANLGRLMESRGSARNAITQYELAMSKNPKPQTGAKIQLRLARCYNAISRPLDARLALQRALELDPGNLTARMELDRM